MPAGPSHCSEHLCSKSGSPVYRILLYPQASRQMPFHLCSQTTYMQSEGFSFPIHQPESPPSVSQWILYSFFLSTSCETHTNPIHCELKAHLLHMRKPRLPAYTQIDFQVKSPSHIYICPKKARSPA